MGARMDKQLEINDKVYLIHLTNNWSFEIKEYFINEIESSDRMFAKSRYSNEVDIYFSDWDIGTTVFVSRESAINYAMDKVVNMMRALALELKNG